MSLRFAFPSCGTDLNEKFLHCLQEFNRSQLLLSVIRDISIYVLD